MLPVDACLSRTPALQEKVKVAQATEAIAAVGHVPDAAKKNRELKTS